ncbi:MAG: DUF1523 family protein [Alphaproteobacteria bacterium]|nr:MAG: DUF1523 family protein [Alphaproteobacteria bacterium]
MLRLIKRILLAAILIAVAALMHHYLPQHDIVRITGTDVIRSDPAGPDQATRDVRYIYGETPDGETREYRNEDTGWGFPFYFKFDSGKLQARASSLQSTRDNPVWVVVTHYGWRITYLSLYPNAVAIREATGPDERIIPWFNIVFLSLLGVLVVWVAYRIRRFRRETVEPFLEETAGEASGLWRRLRRALGGR